MPTVHLVRHGEVANPNHVVYADLEGFNLSATGVLQAHHAALHLEAVPVDIVLTSPLARAVQTATAIGRHHNLEPTISMGLTETRQYPGWTGERWADIASLFPGQLERYLADASSLDDVVETIHDVASRVIAEIERVIDHGARHIVVVGHQDPTQAARLTLIGRQLSELLMDPPTHASVVTLERLDDGRWREMAVWGPFVDQTAA
jgi:probable phosphoglycerate mutase